MIPTDVSGVNYYRMAAWAKEMRKYRNVEVAMYGFQYDTNERHPWQLELFSVPDIRERIESLMRACDVAVWQPVHYDHTLEFFNDCRQKYGKYTIVETDDNYVDVPPWNDAQRSFRPGARPRAIGLQCLSMADAVTTTTPHLKDVCLRFNENVHLVQNSIDFVGDRKFVGWDQVSVRKHRGIRIGWIGGRSHYEDLMLVAPALREILEKYPEVTLVLVNSALEQSCKVMGIRYPFQGLDNVRIFDRGVPINRYATFAASFGFDIGIAPLVDCNFNRSKSNLRWLEYSALKIPTVATDISHFRQSIKNAEDGFLVKNNDLDEWVTRLGILIRDQGLRERIGQNAYKRVKRDFNVKKNAATYTRLLKDISDFSVTDPEYQALPDGQYSGVGAN
jgi:glycosyltransferase involved in cell wall biosynthesis